MRGNYMDHTRCPDLHERISGLGTPRPQSWCRSERHAIAYSLISGLIGSMIAATASLVVTGVARVIVWGAVVSSVSVFAGITYGLAQRRPSGSTSPCPPPGNPQDGIYQRTRWEDSA